MVLEELGGGSPLELLLCVRAPCEKVHVIGKEIIVCVCSCSLEYKHPLITNFVANTLYACKIKSILTTIAKDSLTISS